MIIHIKKKLRNKCKTELRQLVNKCDDSKLTSLLVKLLEQMDKTSFKRGYKNDFKAY